MINVDDLTGQVSMLLNDYETLRNRRDKDALSLENEKSDFEEERRNFKEGLAKKSFNRTINNRYAGPGYESSYPPHYLETRYEWIGNKEVIKEIEEKFEKESREYRENLLKKFRYMNIFKFIKWRNSWIIYQM